MALPAVQAVARDHTPQGVPATLQQLCSIFYQGLGVCAGQGGQASGCSLHYVPFLCCELGFRCTAWYYRKGIMHAPLHLALTST